MSDLVQRVARAIQKSIEGGCDIIPAESATAARAAIRVALEEAASVADAENVDGDDPEVRNTAAGIAAAIRALIPNEG